MDYKVKALSVLGLNNRIYSSGDIVTEHCFPAGNADKLVLSGFLEKIGDAKKNEDLKTFSEAFKKSLETPKEDPKVEVVVETKKAKKSGSNRTGKA